MNVIFSNNLSLLVAYDRSMRMPPGAADVGVREDYELCDGASPSALERSAIPALLRLGVGGAGLAGMAVGRARGVEGPGGLALYPRAGRERWPGLISRCRPAGALPWCGPGRGASAGHFNKACPPRNPCPSQ